MSPSDVGDEGDPELPSRPEDYPPVDFPTFVLSLSRSALMLLNGVDDRGNRIEKDLPLARHNIDLLGMLEEKTKGNLTGEEERLLGQVLSDLRLQYVRAINELTR